MEYTMSTNGLINITVTISGPGNTFHREQLIIKKALSDAGYNVTVQDDYPVSSELEDVMLCRKQIALRSKNTNITIVADHCPWGG
jgi:hypothetical protein